MKKVDFDKVVSESLLRLHHALAKKIDWDQMKLNEEYRSCFTTVVFLHSVALNPFDYCAPGKDFDTNMKELSFDVPRFYSLFTLDQKIAQCVYDIMICTHDYLCYGDDKKLSGIRALKYNSQQDAINAMDILRRDCVYFTGGTIPYVAWKLFGRAK